MVSLCPRQLLCSRDTEPYPEAAYRGKSLWLTGGKSFTIPEDKGAAGLRWQARHLEQKPRVHILNLRHETESRLKIVRVFKSSKSASNDILPSTRPLLQSLTKDCHQLGTKCSNSWACQDISNSDYHSLSFHEFICSLIYFQLDIDTVLSFETVAPFL